MKYLVFDIETRNTFEQVGSDLPSALDLSILSIFDSRDNSMKSFEMNELEKAWPLFEGIDFLVGFNSDHFDIPLLDKYYPGDLHKIKSIDLMKSVKETLGRRIKLDNIAGATLGKNKIANGLEAIKWWNEGKIDLIIKYCEEDVYITRDVFLYALNNKKVFATDREGKKIEIAINTDDWKADEKKPEIQSLF
jgi:DEAD/DEAH box helicase domain-containing protein